MVNTLTSHTRYDLFTASFVSPLTQQSLEDKINQVQQQAS